MRWGVLVGGTGSNLKAMLTSGFSVSLVISHKAGVKALEIARDYGLESCVLMPKDYPDRQAYDAALVEQLSRFGIERVAMAGFLRWLTPETIARYPGAIVNLHPSLLPAYPGLHAIERAFSDGVLWSGVTVHFVDEGHDTGPIVAQVPVPRLVGDALADFEERIHAAEHALYPQVLKALDRGQAALIDGRVEYKKENDQWMHGH
ncbi:MAG: phosphoribosylglycinamide formyltransferase [Thermaerobacter sp.]|nr:phosphoribosylglycinamide formyltransferase [Thermaerobacter sp.]